MIDQFVSDLQFERQDSAVIVRSPAPSGILSEVQLPPLPEGYAFYGAAQLPARRTVEVCGHELPLFAAGGIMYQGQAVGILTGADPALLESLRDSIRIDIAPHPDESFEAGHAHTLFDYPIIAKQTDEAGDIDSIFEVAPSTVFSSLKIASQYIARSEPFSVITVFREDGLDVYVPTQWPFHVRAAVAKATELEETQVVVYPTRTGESANELLWYPSLLACQCAVAAVLQRKTVRLFLSAEESYAAAPKTPEIIIEHKSVIQDSSIAAMQISILVNAGACCPLIDRMLAQMTAAALGPYRIPNYRIEARAARTPQGLIDIFEGWGDYYTSNALENHLAKIIQDYNFSPAQWRLAHIQDGHAEAFTSLFQMLKGKSDFACKYAAYHLFNSGKRDRNDGRWRGIGLAMGFQYSGYAAGFTYTAEMELNTRNQLVVTAEPAGEDVKKIIRVLAAEKLGIAESDVVFAGLTTADMNVSGPATAGNTVSILLPLIEQCLNDLQDQRFRNPLPINISRSFPLAPMAQPQAADMDMDTGTEGLIGSACIAQLPVTCMVELELDTACYEVIIRGIWFACESGKVYERKQALSYVRKNITAALSRICKGMQPSAGHTEPGDAQPGNLLPYSVYRTMLPNEIPPVSVSISERDGPMNTFDSCAANILPAAYLAALNQILLRVPGRIDSLPIFTEDIFKVLEHR